MKPEGRRTSFELDPKAGKEITKRTQFLITDRESMGCSRSPERRGSRLSKTCPAAPPGSDETST